jgi:hypothetical protein
MRPVPDPRLGGRHRVARAGTGRERGAGSPVRVLEGAEPDRLGGVAADPVAGVPRRAA